MVMSLWRVRNAAYKKSCFLNIILVELSLQISDNTHYTTLTALPLSVVALNKPTVCLNDLCGLLKGAKILTALQNTALESVLNIWAWLSLSVCSMCTGQLAPL